MGGHENIDYDPKKAAADWVAGEVAGGRLPDIPRSEEEIQLLFTPENVIKHMAIRNPESRGTKSDFGF